MSVDVCKTLDVWREITCSSLFSGTWQHPHSHSSLVLFFYFKSGLCRDTRVHHTKSLTAASIKIFNWAPQSFDKFLDLNSSVYSGILLIIGTFPLWVLPRCSSLPLHGLLYTLKCLFGIWTALDLVKYMWKMQHITHARWSCLPCHLEGCSKACCDHVWLLLMVEAARRRRTH